MVIIIGALGAIAFMALIFLIAAFCEWSETHSGSPRMKFNQWRDIYYVKPSRWTLYCDGPATSIGSYCETYVRFSFIDYYRYKWWRYRENKRELERDNNKELQRILEQAQDDIDALKKKADREMEEAMHNTKEIAKRISEMN